METTETGVGVEDLEEPTRQSAIELIHPVFWTRVATGLEILKQDGLVLYPFETLRSPERQDWMFAFGRTVPGRILTRARAWSSWHQYGLAVDLVFDGDPSTAKIDWSWTGNWQRFGEVMEAQGLTWLGSPKSEFNEMPHVQLTAGMNLIVARSLFNEGGIPLVWDRFNQLLEAVV